MEKGSAGEWRGLKGGTARRLTALACLGLLAAGVGLALATGPVAAEEVGEGAAADGAALAAAHMRTAPSEEDTAVVGVAKVEGRQVEKLADGRLVQATPSIATDPRGGTYSLDYNVDILQADGRGCHACHEDLGKTLRNMGYDHLLLDTGVNTEVTWQQCHTCHGGGSYGSLASAMHAIHGVAGPGAAGMASCFDCHSVDTATGEFALWDDVKYSEMRGISTLDTVGAAFSFDQDTVVPADELPNLNWLLRDEDFTRYENEEEGAPLDEERFDTWTLSVTGDVQQEVTFSLPELIEKAPSVTVPMKYHCDENPFAGPVVAQVEVTGIPLDWFLEQAGLTDTSEVVNFFSPDGFGGGLFGTKLDDLAKREVLLVYEVNGERLGWDDGYPLAAWIGGTHATKCTKEVCEIRVGSEAPARYDSFIPGTLATAGLNKPNVGVIGTPSGVVVQAGETYTFEGYADAFEANVSGLEFSLDGGQNWTHFDTPGTDFDRWVYWRLAWTAPEGADAAYVLQIRGVCEDGTVTPEPLSVLVNVKADLPAFEDEVDAALEANG